MNQHPLWREDYVKLAYMIELLSRNHCRRKQNNVKRLQWAKVHKDWTIEQWNKVLWTDKSKFEMFGSNRRVYMWQRVDERTANPLCHTNRKAWRRLCNDVGSFCQLQSREFAPGERQMESDWPSQHTVVSWSHLKHSLGVKDLYSCKIVIQRIQVNAIRNTLKAKRNSMSWPA